MCACRETACASECVHKHRTHTVRFSPQEIVSTFPRHACPFLQYLPSPCSPARAVSAERLLDIAVTEDFCAFAAGTIRNPAARSMNSTSKRTTPRAARMFLKIAGAGWTSRTSTRGM